MPDSEDFIREQNKELLKIKNAPVAGVIKKFDPE